MNISRRDMLALIAASVTTNVFANDSYPNKPIRILVPNPPGGASDVSTRMLAEKLAKVLGQAVVVENKSGGNGALAAGFLANSKADGYTVMVGLSGVVQAPWIMKNLPYTLDQIQPVTLFGKIPIAFAVSPNLQVETLDEFITIAKAKPGALSYASYGIGSSAHAYGEILCRSAGIKLLHVPYKGEQPALTDLMGGVVDSTFLNPGTAKEMQKAKKVKVIAMASATRSKILPEVPTFKESGIAAIDEAGWGGFFAPAGTPKEVVDKLSREIGKLIEEPDLKVKLAQFLETEASSPQQFSDLVRRDYERWGKIFKSIGVKAQ